MFDPTAFFDPNFTGLSETYPQPRQSNERNQPTFEANFAIPDAKRQKIGQYHGSSSATPFSQSSVNDVALSSCGLPDGVVASDNLSECGSLCKDVSCIRPDCESDGKPCTTPDCPDNIETCSDPGDCPDVCQKTGECFAATTGCYYDDSTHLQQQRNPTNFDPRTYFPSGPTTSYDHESASRKPWYEGQDASWKPSFYGMGYDCAQNVISTGERFNDVDHSLFPMSCAWSACDVKLQNAESLESHLRYAHLTTEFQGPQNIPEAPSFADHQHDKFFDSFAEFGMAPEYPAVAFGGGSKMSTRALDENSSNIAGNWQCLWEKCDKTLPRSESLITHLHDTHGLPITVSPEDDIDLLNTDIGQSSKLGTMQHLEAAPVPWTRQLSFKKRKTIPLDTVQDPGDTVAVEHDLHSIKTDLGLDLDQFLADLIPAPSSAIPGVDDHLVCKWLSQDGCVCGVSCVDETRLHEHIKSEHLSKLERSNGFYCNWGGCRRNMDGQNRKGFTQKGKLERHMASHTNYKCCTCTHLMPDGSKCGKQFSAPQALKQHELLHTGERPWQCRFCEKTFPQQSAKTIHERTHTKEKPLRCDLCMMRFSESSNLAKHRKIHGEKGLHACKEPGCKKTYHRLDQLKLHEQRHRDGSNGSGSGSGSRRSSMYEGSRPGSAIGEEFDATYSGRK